MRHLMASIITLTCFSMSAEAEPVSIDQSAWLNYAIVVNTSKDGSDLRLSQSGMINGISSVQITDASDAQIWTHQRGRRNGTQIYQSGWNTIAAVVQEGPGQTGARTDLPTQYTGQQTDEGYLSYFASGGFSFLALTDSKYTWTSRFGRAR